MAQRRGPGFQLLPLAYLAWEGETIPLRLDEVVDRLFALADSDITIDRLTSRGPWRLTAVLEDRRLALLGSRDAGGAWTAVHLVHTLSRARLIRSKHAPLPRSTLARRPRR